MSQLLDPEAVKKTIQELLIASPKGCSVRQLVQNYKLVSYQELPYLALGFSSPMAYLNSMPSLVTVTRRRDGTLLTATTGTWKSPESTEPHAQSTTVFKVREVKPCLKKQLASLMLSYPNGLRLNDFQEAFARRFSFYFSFRDCGFSTLAELIRAIPNILTIDFAGPRGVMVYAASEEAVQSSGINWAKLTKERQTSDLSKLKKS